MIKAIRYGHTKSNYETLLSEVWIQIPGELRGVHKEINQNHIWYTRGLLHYVLVSKTKKIVDVDTYIVVMSRDYLHQKEKSMKLQLHINYHDKV